MMKDSAGDGRGQVSDDDGWSGRTGYRTGAGAGARRECGMMMMGAWVRDGTGQVRRGDDDDDEGVQVRARARARVR